MIQKIKELREKTNQSLNDCKKALERAGGSVEDALILLQGIQIEKNKNRETKDASEGQIYTYVHTGGQIASMVEINCETDFAARSKEFNNFCEIVALQIVAMQPIYIYKNEISKEQEQSQFDFFKKMFSDMKEQKLSKGGVAFTKDWLESVIDERMKNWYREVVLLEQTCVTEQNKTIFDLLSELSAKLNEKVTIARFERWSIR